MKYVLCCPLLALLLASLLPAEAQVRTYDVITATVPFKFTVGDQTFRPGEYQFIVVGVGLLALRDEHRHVIASLVTRAIETGEPSLTTQLVFTNKKKGSKQLTRVILANRSQVLEVIGEQLAMRSSPPAQAPSSSLPIDSLPFSGRGKGFRLRE